MTWRLIEDEKTGRFLENQSYRTLQNNSHVKTEGSYDSYRTYENQCPRDLEQSGRMTQDCLLRVFENHGTRITEGSHEATRLLANCYGRTTERGDQRLIESPNCKLRATDLNVTAVIVNGELTVTYTVNITCGNYSGQNACIIYYQAFLLLPLYPPPSSVIWSSPCYQVSQALPCGSTFPFSGFIGGNMAPGGNYRVEIAVWNSIACNANDPNAWPNAYVFKNFKVPIS
jgi:hypothetical protein